ncbi:MAG: hypothetical protein QOG62_1677 [Thermoleophilaceae bacterium]|jgi:uncharacterized repeat protein (TIGR01451 family)|nr:hypothetical protein [Thermoleophilaceae bacterium]
MTFRRRLLAGAIALVAPLAAVQEALAIDGDFVQSYSISYPDWPIGDNVNASATLAFGNLDGDGNPDLVAAEYDPGTNGDVVVRRGTGTGQFQPLSSRTSPLAPTDLVLADFDPTGGPEDDLVAVLAIANQIALYRNDGDGNLAAPDLTPIAGGMSQVEAADIDEDGDQDLVVSGTTNDAQLLKNDGLGTFTPTTVGAGTRSNDQFSDSLAVGDFVGTGNHLDVATARQATGQVSVAEGDGNGNFAPVVTLTETSHGYAPFGVAAADVTGDSRDDLLVSAGNFLGVVPGQAALPPGFAADDGDLDVPSASLHPGDVNGDGDIDIVRADRAGSGGLRALLGDGTGNFTPAPFPSEDTSEVFDVAAADVTGDGSLDVGTTYLFSGAVAVFESDLQIADIEVNLRPDRAAIELGQDVTITPRIHNKGPDTAPNVTLGIDLDNPTAVTSGTSCNDQGGGLFDCPLAFPDYLSGVGTIGDFVTFEPTQTGTTNPSATVTTTASDATPADNTDTAALTVSSPGPPGASVDPGDLVAGEINFIGATPGLIAVDGVTGARETLTATGRPAGGEDYDSPGRVAFETGGAIVAPDGEQLLRVNPANGQRSVLSQDGVAGAPGNPFYTAFSAAIADNGDIFVADLGPDNGGSSANDGQIMRVEPASGTRHVVADSATLGFALRDPVAVAIERTGDLLVLDHNSPLHKTDLIRIDPGTGTGSVLSPSAAPGGGAPDLNSAVGLALERDGNIVVADLGSGPSATGSIQSVNPATGHRQVISDSSSAGPDMGQPGGVVVQQDGNLLTTDVDGNQEAAPGVIKVDRASGDRSFFSVNNAPAAGPAFRRPVTLALRPYEADLSTNLTDSGPVQVNSNYAYTLQVLNAGPSKATDVVATLQLPAGVALRPGAADARCTALSQTVTCSDPETPSGGSESFAVGVTAPPQAGSPQASAGAAAYERDPSPANNSSSATTTVNALPPALEPEQDERLVVDNIQGTVLIRGPDGKFIPLTADQVIPVGTVIDTTHGSVEIVSEGRHGRLRSAIFSEGLFQIQQAEGGRITEAILKGGGINSCRNKPVRGKGKKSKPKRQLFGNGGGGHRTTGAYGSASVRGTQWRTIDTCKGSRFFAIEHSITVNDFVAGREVIVREGDSYLARSR